jgi:4-alpha-glucanotransferase
LEADPSPDLEAALKRRQRWQRDVLDEAAQHVPEMAGARPWIAQLLLAADSFLSARPLPGQPNGKSVIAGYPWFGDWGRNTMISLPGLTLATGREEWGRDILLTFARFVDRGMLPNVFPGAGDKTPSMRLCGSLRPGELIWRRAAIARASLRCFRRSLE